MIIKRRQTVKSLLSECVVCKKLQGKPYSFVSEPPSPVFMYLSTWHSSKIAADSAGPHYVQNMHESKRICVNVTLHFLPMLAQGLYILNLLHADLTGSAFIGVSKRFTGRRGLPNFLLSDNGHTFHDKKVKRYVLIRDIEWRLNVSTASWWNFLFEICLKLTKRCLKKKFFRTLSTSLH